MDEARDQGPHHLAQTVLRALSVSEQGAALPGAWQLEFFFDALYQASFRGEGGRPLTGRVVWLGPASPIDISPVNISPAETPGALRLLPPVPLNISSLVSLMTAAGSVSALLVSGTLPLAIHGLRLPPPFFQRRCFAPKSSGPRT